MMKEQYIWYYNQAKSKLYSMSNEDIENFIQHKLAEVDAARHVIRERTGKIEVLPPLDQTNLVESTVKKLSKKDPKKAKKLAEIDFEAAFEEIFDDEENEG